MPEFGKLWMNYKRTVALPWIGRIVILVVGLSRKEDRRINYLCNHRSIPRKYSIQAGNHLPCLGLLLRGMNIYCRSILCADISPLTIKRCWVVCRKEYFQQLPIRDQRRIKIDLNCFGVPCFPGANLLISRIVVATTTIARGNSVDPMQLGKDRLKTPETAARKCCFSHITPTNIRANRS